jgi:hypothetical protein
MENEVTNENVNMYFDRVESDIEWNLLDELGIEAEVYED